MGIGFRTRQRPRRRTVERTDGRGGAGRIDGVDIGVLLTRPVGHNISRADGSTTRTVPYGRRSHTKITGTTVAAKATFSTASRITGIAPGTPNTVLFTARLHRPITSSDGNRPQ